MSSAVQTGLPPLGQQAEQVIELGAHEVAGLSPRALRSAADISSPDGALLVIHPSCVPASRLTPLLDRGGKHGFVVVDMPDVDDFTPIEQVTLPASSLYLVHDIDRGDHMANWSPNEALPAVTASETHTPHPWGGHPLAASAATSPRTEPLLHGDRLPASQARRRPGRKDAGAVDQQTGPAEMGRETANAPKVGWCWAGNRHTWLGFASAADRNPPLTGTLHVANRRPSWMVLW